MPNRLMILDASYSQRIWRLMAGRMHSTKGYTLISGINDIFVGRVIADARAGLATGATARAPQAMC
jgi:hypothetical protein